MKKSYMRYVDKEITREILDSVKIGDYVRCNDWKRSMKVVGVSENYFVMAIKAFGRWIYSVCEKTPFKGIRHNSLIGGYFSIGTDNYSFGVPMKNAYEFDNEEFISKYLKAFEEKDCELSMRRSCALISIAIRSDST